MYCGQYVAVAPVHHQTTGLMIFRTEWTGDWGHMWAQRRPASPVWQGRDLATGFCLPPLQPPEVAQKNCSSLGIN